MGDQDEFSVDRLNMAVGFDTALEKYPDMMDKLINISNKLELPEKYSGIYGMDSSALSTACFTLFGIQGFKVVDAREETDKSLTLLCVAMTEGYSSSKNSFVLCNTAKICLDLNLSSALVKVSLNEATLFSTDEDGIKFENKGRVMNKAHFAIEPVMNKVLYSNGGFWRISRTSYDSLEFWRFSDMHQVEKVKTSNIKEWDCNDKSN